MADPLREVALIKTCEGSRGGRYYSLTLECGHTVFRRPSLKAKDVGGMLVRSAILLAAPGTLGPAPRRSRCYWCGWGKDPEPVVYIPGVNCD